MEKKDLAVGVRMGPGLVRFCPTLPKRKKDGGGGVGGG